MTNREIAHDLMLAEAGHHSSVDRVTVALDAAERRGAIKALSKMLKAFRVDFICRGWAERMIVRLGSGETINWLKAEENKR